MRTIHGPKQVDSKHAKNVSNENVFNKSIWIIFCAFILI